MNLIPNYQLIEKIGQGAYGHIYKAKDLETNELRAIKVETRAQDASEFELQKEAESEGVVKVHSFSSASYPEKAKLETTDKESFIYSVMDLHSIGDFFSFIYKKGALPEEVARFYFKHIITILDSLASKGIYHRDVKPENFLLDADLNLKLTDFGFATKETSSSKVAGTSLYCSPEALEGSEYNCLLNDVFSAGVICFVMVTGLYPADTSDCLFQRITKSQKFHSLWSKVNSGISSQFKDLFERIMMPQSLRITLEEIKAHPWFSGPTMSYLKWKESELEHTTPEQIIIPKQTPKIGKATTKKREEDQIDQLISCFHMFHMC